MVDFTLNARAREDMGKGASRRLRRLADEVPAIVYGGKKAPQNISLTHNELSRALDNEAFYSHIIKLNVDGKGQDVILKDVQRHPAKPKILHADFLRVDKATKLHTRIPLHFLNEEKAVGVKQQGGIVSHLMSDLEVQCLPADLPEYIEVDIAALELGGIIHISDIQLPSGVEAMALLQGEDHDLPVVSIHKAKVVVEEEPTEAEDAADEGDKDDAKGQADED